MVVEVQKGWLELGKIFVFKKEEVLKIYEIYISFVYLLNIKSRKLNLSSIIKK